MARGGLGRIVEGFDHRLGRRVALKELIARNEKAEARFIREAKITARLEHPSIVPIHEAGRWSNGERFYAMKLVEGRTLADALAEADTREKRLELLPHLIDVAEAVAYAHSQGILHRDLKPANVMVGAFGETVLIDWGLAKDLKAGPDADDDPLSAVASSEKDEERPGRPVSVLRGRPARSSTETSDGIVVGTPPYMSPEQARADPLDERADVYALGAMLYQVLCGDRPYQGVSPKDVLLAVVQGPPAPIEELAPDMPKDLVAIVRKAMHRNPALRYPSAKEMAEELRRFSTGQLVGAHRYSAVERGLRFARRNAATLTVALLFIGVLAGFATWSFRRLAARTEAAVAARQLAEDRVRELTLEKARSLLGRDPTEAAAWLLKIRPPIRGAPSVAAAARELGVARSILSGHLQEVDLVRFGPKGRYIASGSRDGTVRLYSGTGAPLDRFDHGARISALAFVPDGDGLATGAYDGRVRLYPLRGGPPLTMLAHTAPVSVIRFAPTGDRFVTLGRDRRLILWTLDGRVAARLEAPPVGDWAEALFVDAGRWLVTAGHGARVILWDLDEGEGRLLFEPGADVTALAESEGLVAVGFRDGAVAIIDPERRSTRTLGGHAAEVRALEFSPDGSRLASASFEGRVILWPLDSMEPARVFDEHDERVTGLRFSPVGRYLASASWDGTVRVRDLETSEISTLRGHGQVVTDLDFAPSGRLLVSASWDTSVRLWPVDPSGRAVLSGHEIGVHAVDFSPDGRSIASGGHDDELRLWDLRTREAQVLAGHGDNVYRVRFSPNGRWLASSSDDRTVRLWPADGGTPRILRGHLGDVEELAFSQDGRWLASAGREGDLFLWPVAGGEAVKLDGHRRAVSGLGFVVGGRLATAGLDGRVLLWPLGPGTPRRLLEGASPVRALDVTRDGNRLAAAGGQGELWVWALPEGRRLHHLTGLVEPDVVRLSPDGTHAAVASAQRGLWLCNLAYELCDELEGHEARVFDLEFSPSGRALVTGSGDHGVRLFDVETHESRVLLGHRAPVFDVAFSPDGAWVASGSGDTDVRLWPVLLPPRLERLPEYLEALTEHRIRD